MKWPWRMKAGLAVVILVLISLPGQNDYQTLGIKPQAPRVRGAEIAIAQELVPVNVTGVKALGLTARAALVARLLRTRRYRKKPWWVRGW